MKKAVTATYYHSISTDNELQYQYCPQGADSWSAFRVAEAENKFKGFPSPFSTTSRCKKRPFYQYTKICPAVAILKTLMRVSILYGVWPGLAPKHLNCGSKIT
ncbi:hypothetical protein J437_LFUL017015 [Ladona fulva]|uniref:Uncharacterized protein n=1 Tax=Ladona fulva TaxID=123851 RepID=A0A8K0KJT8_LADFU|nr:hypothetical protein J437_LFUL017015 [Ladona fulva]